VTIDWVRPDKFLMLTKTAVGWRNGQAARYEGFSSSLVIDDLVLPPDTPDTTTLVPESSPPRTPEESARRERNLLAAFRNRCLALTLPLFGRSVSGAPLTFVAAGRVTIASGPADRLEAQAADGRTLVLYLDATSHFPVRLEGIAWPLGTAWTNAIIARAHTGTPTDATTVPPRDPVTGTVITQGALVTPPSELRWLVPPGPGAPPPPTTYALAYADYRCGHGVCWPHRFSSMIDGRTVDELSVGSFAVNAKIPNSTFKPK
jgi:hypothetical protein